MNRIPHIVVASMNCNSFILVVVYDEHYFGILPQYLNFLGTPMLSYLAGFLTRLVGLTVQNL